MKNIAYLLPDYTDDIVSAISRRDWIIHNFDISPYSELYNPCNYLYNREFNKYTYSLVLDLNVYQFLLGIIKKTNPKGQYRDAAALLAFCQISKIEIDPTFSIYERLNYQKSNIDEAITDLELLRNLDNCDTNELAKFALGKLDSIDIGIFVKVNRDELKYELLKYNKLLEWDSFYLMLLAIVDIKYDENIPDNKKLQYYVEWSIKDFRFSLVALAYATILFGNKPAKRMMKYKLSHNSSNRKTALVNMTWDIFIMNYFFKKWSENKKGNECLFASDDRAFRASLRLAIQVQKTGSLLALKNHAPPKLLDYLANQIEYSQDSGIRAYNTEKWGREYRSELIRNYENKLIF